MVHVLLICCVMLGDDAKPSANIANDRVAYEAAQKKAGQNPAAHVQLALWCEVHGMPVEREKHLKLAVAFEPGNSLARGLMGLVAFKGAWAKPDQVEQEPQNDPKFQAIFREYLDRRVRTPQKADAPTSARRLVLGKRPEGRGDGSLPRRHADRSFTRHRLDQARIQEA